MKKNLLLFALLSISLTPAFADVILPIRQGLAKISIGKYSITGGNGHDSIQSEDICTKSFALDVFDLRKILGGSINTQSVSCTAKVNGQDQTISIEADVEIFHQDLMGTGVASDYKYFNTLMTIRSGNSVLEFRPRNAIVDDLSLKTLRIIFGQDIIPGQTASGKEIVGAIVEFDDSDVR